MDGSSPDGAGSDAEASFCDGSDPHLAAYQSYFGLVTSGLQKPASQPSDQSNTIRAYSTAAYSMGAVFLSQLKYMMGDAPFYLGMKRYYNTWKMHHPEPNDFLRVMEKVSGLQLHWYYRYWINTTKHIDYGIGDILERDGSTLVTLQRI